MVSRAPPCQEYGRPVSGWMPSTTYCCPSPRISIFCPVPFGAMKARDILVKGSSVRSGMSNCVVGSGGLRLPCSIIAEHSVEGCDHFSHDGDDDDLGFFVGGGEAFVKGLEGGTVTACAEGGHVEDVTDRHPTTIDAAVSLELAAVEVIWREADEGGDLFAAHLPEFWQQGDEREGQHRADAWHRGQQFIAL